MRFAGKVALVTGSSRGIGRAIALQLAGEGPALVVNYRKQAEAAAATVADIEALGRRALAVRADIGDPEALRDMFNRVKDSFGGMDFLICNAAAGVQSSLMDMPLKAWDLSMNVNARGYLLCAQRAFPLMAARGGGRMIALTARNGTEGAARGYGPVAVSKAAINTLTFYLAVELAPHNIIVNAVSPGIVETEALANFDVGEELRVRAKTLTPTGRVTTAEDVALLVAFLCSEEARQVNGQIIEIDGGYGRLFL